MLLFICVLIALSFLIIAHEWGHFFVARRFQVFVEEFGFGFPPRIITLWKTRRARRVIEEEIKTEKIDIKTNQGELVEEIVTEKVSEIDEIISQRQWNVLLGRKPVEPEEIGDTIYSINAIPLGGYVRLFGEHEFPKGKDPEILRHSFLNQAIWKRIAIICAGIVMNLIVGWIILSSIFMIGAPQGVLITQVLPGSPGDIAGFHAQDVVTGYTTIDTFMQFLVDHGGKKVSVTVRRSGGEKTLTVVPRAEVKQGEGRVGIAITDIGFPREPFFTAIKDGFLTAVWIVWMIFVALYEIVRSLFVHGVSPIGELSGPVGIFKIAYEAGTLGFIYVVELIGVISINLAALNILPIPGLDGGRLLFLIVEKLRGKRIHPKREAMIHGIGVAVLMLLILILTFRDLVQLF